jgi:hypothetical protein
MRVAKFNRGLLAQHVLQDLLTMISQALTDRTGHGVCEATMFAASVKVTTTYWDRILLSGPESKSYQSELSTCGGNGAAQFKRHDHVT